MSQREPLKRKITRAYIFALCVVASLSVVAYFAARHALHIEARSTDILRLATRQLAYPPRIGAALRELIAEPNDARARRRLQTLHQQFREDHAALAGDEAFPSAPALDSEGLAHIYFQPPLSLDQRVRHLLGAVEQLLGDPSMRADAALLTDLAHEAEVRLPPLQRVAVDRLAAEGHDRVEQAQSITLVVLGVTLATLLLEGVYVFRPLTGMIMRRARALADATSRLERAVVSDPLTGLPNRAGLERLLSERLGRGEGERGFGLLLLDLDRFNALNHTLGHAIGDIALKAVARRLSGVLGPDDALARLGGDEFAILKQGADDPEKLAAAAVETQAVLRPPIRDGRVDYPLTASIGLVAASESLGSDFRPAARESAVDRLLMDADIALYQAKSRGRDRAEPFVRRMREDQTKRQRLGLEIREALKAGAFEPFLQPQIAASDGALIGFEALARWRHPTRGLLSPMEFMGVAEELGLVARIDSTIFRKVCAQSAEWRAAGLAPPRIAVNLSARRLAQDGLAEEIEQALAAHDLSPKALAVEILESVMLESPTPAVLRNIERLSALGVEIELDDFGTGHASLSNLRRLRPNRIKIDRSFVIDIESDPSQRDLVAAMLELARRLGVKTLVEGVETAEQETILRALGCDALQGFRYARPMPIDEAADWLANTAGGGSSRLAG